MLGRAKQDKSLILSMKDLYFKTLRVYSHSGKVCENLASKCLFSVQSAARRLFRECILDDKVTFSLRSG